MTENAPPAPVVASPETVAKPSLPPVQFNIGEEFGTARKNLPPAKIVLIGLGAILVITIVVSLIQRRQPATGTIDNVVVAPVPGQTQVMVAIGISLINHGKKPYVIHGIKADLQATSGDYSDDAAAASDFQRYSQGFPILQQHAVEPLGQDSRIAPDGELRGTIIVSFPVTPDTFTNRKSLKVSISAEDQPEPLVLIK